jgi:hypothetical protein
MSEQQTFLKIRDLRQKTQFKIDDIYINGYARLCGTNATLVYLSLCRHAEFESQKAFPSQGKIAFELGISLPSVKRGIKKLSEYNIIKIEKEKIKGRFTNNVYYLLDKSEWLTIAPTDTRLNRSSKTVAHRPPTVRDTQKDNKVLRITNTKDNKDLRITNITVSKETGKTASYGNKDINILIAFFKEQLGGSLDDSQRQNRRFAYLLLNRFKKDYPDKNPVELIQFLIKAGLEDSFHGKNLTNFKYLYYNGQKIIQSIKGRFNQVAIIKTK